MLSYNNTKPPSTFISKYKPYYIGEFVRKEDTDDNESKIPNMVSIIRTLMDIDDLNVLFIGNSGSGKTAILYAILREYYGFSKTDTIPETNILFINNLKEQGINYFRNEMKTFCQSHCSIYGKKKVIVIDDLDTVNEQSQQVFRNYIDKYKSNIHFISACSNIQKVIESLQSRLHIINIHPPTLGQIRECMDRIIEIEGIRIDAESCEFLVKKSNRSIRNVMNNLEKIYIYGLSVRTPELRSSVGVRGITGEDLSSKVIGPNIITLDICKQLCSTISVSQFEDYIRAIRSGNLQQAIHILYDIHDYGYSVIDILEYFFTFVKMTDLMSEDEKYRIIPLLCKYITVFHNIHEDCIELALFTNNLYGVL
jgi:DNA polymerase III delta prime subunit